MKVKQFESVIELRISNEVMEASQPSVIPAKAGIHALDSASSAE